MLIKVKNNLIKRRIPEKNVNKNDKVNNWKENNFIDCIQEISKNGELELSNKDVNYNNINKIILSKICKWINNYTYCSNMSILARSKRPVRPI